MEVRRYGGARDDVSIPNLIEIQTRSYQDFLQQDVPTERREGKGLESLLREIFPIESYDGKCRLEYLKYELGKPLYTVEQCRQLRLTYGMPFRIWVRLVKEQPVEEEVYLGEIPVMIGGGEFIINGAERVIVSQLHRSPGVDFMVDTEAGDRRLHACRIIPERGSWVEMNVTKKEILMVRIDQSGKFPVTMFLRAMSGEYSTNAAIIRAFYKTKTVRVRDSRSFRSLRDRHVLEDIVNEETGEVVIESCGQVTELNFASILDAKGKEPTAEEVTAYVKNHLDRSFSRSRRTWRKAPPRSSGAWRPPSQSAAAPAAHSTPFWGTPRVASWWNSPAVPTATPIATGCRGSTARNRRTPRRI